MSQQRDFITQIVECPNGHRIRLEVLSGTTAVSRSIKCPTCQALMVVFTGDIRGVVPIEDPSI
jgi:hypothetical protein